MDTRRVTARPNNDVIVVNDVAAINAKVVGNEFVLARPVMHQQRVGVSTRTHSQCLTGSHRDDVNVYTARRFEQRQDVIKQAGISHRGCGTERDESLHRLTEGCNRGGQALALGARGDADALLVHDRAGEQKFLADGFGIDRRDVIYNDFVVVGPSSDPARIRGLKNVRHALSQIARAAAPFASRGDDSGTHRTELRLWKAAGITPDLHRGWYRNVGQGMGATLRLAAGMGAYTLTDRATWLNFKNGQGLEILTEVDPALFNPYGSILVNAANRPNAKFGDAKIWHEWLTTKPGLDAILSYRINGEELFLPPRAAA